MFTVECFFFFSPDGITPNSGLTGPNNTLYIYTCVCVCVCVCALGRPRRYVTQYYLFQSRVIGD